MVVDERHSHQQALAFALRAYEWPRWLYSWEYAALSPCEQEAWFSRVYPAGCA